MTVRELIEMLSEANQDASVFIQTYYDEGKPTKVTGMISDSQEIILTDEELS